MLDVAAVSSQALVQEFDRDLRREGLARLTIRTYCNTVARLLCTYPHVPIDELTGQHIERFLDELHLRPATYHLRCAQLKVFFAWCVARELCTRNPVQSVRRPRKRRPAPRHSFFIPTFYAMCHYCLTLEERMLIDILFWTGVRIAELRALRVRDVDLVRRRLYVWHGKGGRSRTIPLLPPTARLLRRYLWEYLLLHGDLYLFRNPKQAHQPRGSHWIERMTRRLGRAVGLPYKTTAHVFRHSCAKTMKLLGVPPDVAQQILGHSTPRITIELYGQLTVEEVQAVYQRRMAAAAAGHISFKGVEVAVGPDDGVWGLDKD